MLLFDVVRTALGCLRLFPQRILLAIVETDCSCSAVFASLSFANTCSSISKEAEMSSGHHLTPGRDIPQSPSPRLPAGSRQEASTLYLHFAEIHCVINEELTYSKSEHGMPKRMCCCKRLDF